MKKLFFLCCIMITVLCCSCGKSSLAGIKECSHNNYELDGVRYEYGECCEDPKSIYVICSDCGEEIKAGEVPSDRKCSSGFNEKELVREATCTEEGLVKWVCDDCDTVYTYPLDKVEHLNMHFWGEENSRCATCGNESTEEVASHVCEYEPGNIKEYSTKFRQEWAGERYYTCKECDYYYAEYFDEYGDFDLEKALESVRNEAKKAGYHVILDTDKLTDSNEYQCVKRDLEYCDTSSIEFTQDITEVAKELLSEALMLYSDPTECYMYVKIDYIGDQYNARFHIELRFENMEFFKMNWYGTNPIL